MSDTKSLCAKISVELHTKVRESQEECGLTLNQYMEKILTEYYEGGKITMSEKTRTMAFQISEDLFAKIKEHLKRNGISQKDFVIGLIEQALATTESAERSQAEPQTDTVIAESNAETTTDEPHANEPNTNPQGDETATDDPTADEQGTCEPTDDEQETE